MGICHVGIFLSMFLGHGESEKFKSTMLAKISVIFEGMARERNLVFTMLAKIGAVFKVVVAD